MATGNTRGWTHSRNAVFQKSSHFHHELVHTFALATKY